MYPDLRAGSHCVISPEGFLWARYITFVNFELIAKGLKPVIWASRREKKSEFGHKWPYSPLTVSWGCYLLFLWDGLCNISYPIASLWPDLLHVFTIACKAPVNTWLYLEKMYVVFIKCTGFQEQQNRMEERMTLEVEDYCRSLAFQVSSLCLPPSEFLPVGKHNPEHRLHEVRYVTAHGMGSTTNFAFTAPTLLLQATFSRCPWQRMECPHQLSRFISHHNYYFIILCVWDKGLTFSSSLLKYP